MNRFLCLIALMATLWIVGMSGYAVAQSVTLYTAGPEGLAKGIAKSFTDKTGIKVDV